MNKSLHLKDNRSELEKKNCRREDNRAIKDYAAHRQHFIARDFEAKEFKKQSEAEKTKQEFDNLIKEWFSAIKYKSLESQQINHFAFLRIIAISDKVLPFIFEEFSKRPFMAWLKALPAIVGQDIAAQAQSFPEAVKLWIEWGKENNYLQK